MDILKEVGQLIKKTRKEKNLKQHDIDDNLSRIERGDQNISLIMLQKIAIKLGKKLRILFE